jgi:hypothetical protein
MVILYIYLTCWCMKLVFYQRHHHQLVSLPSQHLDKGASASSPKLADGLARVVCNPNAMRRIHVPVNTVTRGDIALTPRGQG